MIVKCLGAPKAKTKEKGQELLLMYIEIEKTDIVLVSSYTHPLNELNIVNSFGAFISSISKFNLSSQFNAAVSKSYG